jgi:hypothetical protein
MSGGRSRGVVCWKGSEIDLGIDGGASVAGITIGGEIAHEGETEGAREVPVEMILGHIGLEREEDGTVEITALGWSEHSIPLSRSVEGAMLTPLTTD